MESETSLAIEVLVDGEAQLAALERHAFGHGRVAVADQLHKLVRDLVAIRTALGFGEAPEGDKAEIAAPSTRESKFEFQFDGEAVIVVGRGRRGNYAQRVPLKSFMGVVQIVQSFASTPFSPKDMLSEFEAKFNSTIPQYVLYCVLRYLEFVRMCRKAGRGMYLGNGVTFDEVLGRIKAMPKSASPSFDTRNIL